MPDVLDFEAFCVREHTALIRMLTLYCGDRETARDLTQEALARAWVHWRKVRRLDRPDLWVRRVALNLANSNFRHKKVERSAASRLRSGEDSLLVGAEVGDRLLVREALMSLSDRQRTAVLLRFLEDLSVEQTAEMMGCSTGTVKKLTARGLAALRLSLSDDVEVPVDG